jgi:hypothetical protein
MADVAVVAAAAGRQQTATDLTAKLDDALRDQKMMRRRRLHW